MSEKFQNQISNGRKRQNLYPNIQLQESELSWLDTGTYKVPVLNKMWQF